MRWHGADETRGAALRAAGLHSARKVEYHSNINAVSFPRRHNAQDAALCRSVAP